MAEVSVVVVTYQSAGTIADCLASLPEGVAAVVVDNASTDETVSIVHDRFPGVQVAVMERNLGFGTACNRGAALTEGADLLFLNPDAVLEVGAIAALTDALEAEPRTGAVGPLMRDAKGEPELSWGDDPGLWSEWKRAREQHGRAPRPIPPSSRTQVDWVTAGCMLVRREAWQDVGGFDEGYFLYFEDVDLCRRLRDKGWKVVFEPRAAARHGRGASAAQVSAQVAKWYRESQARYYARHRAWVEQALLGLYLRLRARRAGG